MRRGALLPGMLLGAVLATACSPVGAPPRSPEPEPPAAEPFPLPAPEVPPPERARDPVPRRFAEVRALWVVRSTLTSPERVRSMVERAHGAGFNTLVVQVRGRGDAYYAGGLEPRPETLVRRPGFDPLDLVLQEAHARGMEVHAWLNTHLVADAGRLPEDPDHLVHARPDLLAVPRELARELHDRSPWSAAYVEALRDHALRNRDRVEGLFTNPAHPEVRDRIHDVWMDLARRYPLDGMHFDYVRYPGPDYDYSRASLEAFRRWAGPRVGEVRAAELDRAARSDLLAWTEALPEAWAEFRREQVTRLVERVYEGVKAVRPGLLVSAAVFSDPVDAHGARYQAWERWLERGILDVVAPMAYSPDDDRFRRHVSAAVRAAGDPRRVWAGIGTYLTGFDGTLRKIGIARDVGAGGVVLFSYDWMVTEGEEELPAGFLEGVGRRAFGR